MDAIQRMRQRAYDYGYRRSSPYEQVVFAGPGLIQILPVKTGYYYVPRVAGLAGWPLLWTGGAGPA